VQQTIGNLTAATKALEALVLQGKLRHGGHPILRWCAANVTVEQDSNENLKPSKKRATSGSTASPLW
jgi:phage terminase large subunit-like protein